MPTQVSLNKACLFNNTTLQAKVANRGIYDYYIYIYDPLSLRQHSAFFFMQAFNENVFED